MDKEQQLYLIEAVILELRSLLHKYWTNQMDYTEVMTKVQMEIDRLQDLEPVHHEEPTCFLLARPNWGSPSYLHKLDEELWVVEVDDYRVSLPMQTPITALDYYVQYCSDNDFIQDFLVGVEDGTTEFGDNKYANYVRKCFEKYIMEREL